MTSQPTLFDDPRPARFGGETFDPEKDGPRLSGQLAAVKELMSDGHWRTLAEIAGGVGGSEAGVSARLRDLRKGGFGGHTVERKRLSGGLYSYRVLLRSER
jgi:hypothetical protein